MSTDREECRQCGKTWGVTMTPRTDVVCSDCSRIPRLPEGEVRREADGTLVVCLGGDWWLRWKVIGEDPHRITMHGWRADSHVMDCERVGNIHDLIPAPPSVESVRPPRFVDVELPLNLPAEESAVPQAPAQPTDDDYAATLNRLDEQVRLVRNLPPHQLAEPARLAAREDTAPPAWTGHNVTVAHLNGYYARCDTCPHVYDAKSQEDAEDWADAHRADNLIPARPAPAVDGDTRTATAPEEG